MTKREPKRYKDGKRVDTWDIQAGVGYVSVDVYLRRPEHGGTLLSAYCKELEFSLDSTDVSTLRRLCSDKVKELSEVQWESVLIVTLEQRAGADVGFREWRIGGGIRITAYSEQRGRMRGEKVHRTDDRSSVRSGWTESTDTEQRWNNIKQVTTVIADTPEHRAALEQIHTSVEHAGNKLTELLHHGRIDQALKTVLKSGSAKLLGGG